MEVYYAILFFIGGAILGSFYNVVGWRLPKGESLLFPASHCPNCNHRLTTLELIPILSFFMQKGKCKNCHQKISWFYPIFEASSGLLFAIAYLIYGLTPELILALTFISMVLIIMISDYHYFIIPDEVLIFFGLLLGIELYGFYGFDPFFRHLKSAFLAFFLMWGLKLFGDFLFKKESMGGGDIKLMFIFGFLLGLPMSIISIFIGAFIGLPVSIFILYRKKTNIIPFGPFLSLGALVILLTKIDFEWIMSVLT